MDQSVKARLLEHDLSSIALLIEDLPPHPKNTEARDHVEAAKKALAEASAEIHQRELSERYDV